MRSLMQGNLGFFIQVALVLLTIYLLSSGISYYVANDTGEVALSWALFLLGILAGGTAFGIDYWLRHVVRTR